MLIGIMDCVEKGKRLNEAAYGVIVDPACFTFTLHGIRCS